MNLNFLYVWLGIMLVVAITAPIVRKRRKKAGLSEQDFLVAGFALGSSISLVKVLIKVTLEKKLQTDLDWDGTVAICLSCGLGIYISLKELYKLF